RGDAMNLDIQVEWRALPMAGVRRRLREVPGELRGYLTGVPETRWLKHADNLRFFVDETIDHYADHAADLEAILDAASLNPALPSHVAEVIVDLPESRSQSADGATTWSRNGRDFAALGSNGIEILLDRP